MRTTAKRTPEEERAAAQPGTPVADPAQHRPVGDQLQSTVGNAAVGTLLGRTQGPTPLLLEGPKSPLLLEYPAGGPTPPHLPAQPNPPARRPAAETLYLDPSGVAHPHEQPRFGQETVYLDPAGVAHRSEQPLPQLSGEALYLEPMGVGHSRKELERDRRRLNDALDTALSGVFASRRLLLRRSLDLRLGLPATIPTTQYDVSRTGSTLDLIDATQRAAAEQAWLDERITLLRPARWNVDFAKELTAADNKQWPGLKPDWKPRKDDLAALKVAVSSPGPLPADDLPGRVSRLTRTYLKLVTYPRLKELYGDKVTKPGLGERELSKQGIQDLRLERPDVFTEKDDELYREAYRDVWLLMRRGEVPLARLNSWGGATGGQRYLPKDDVRYRDPGPGGQDWRYHLSVAFTDHPESKDWRKITKVHVTFRVGDVELGGEPRYFWKVVKGDLTPDGAAGNNHQPWMLGKAKALLRDHAKDIDCRPPE